MSGKNTGSTRVTAVCVASVMASSVFAQCRVIAVGDEWIMSASAFATDPGNTAAFTLNAAGFLSGGGPGHFLVHSGNFGLTGSWLASTLTGANHVITYNAALPLTLANLAPYDGVFLAGSNGSGAANAAVLAANVNGGGSVLVEAGTGEFGPSPANLASGWDRFSTNSGSRSEPRGSGRTASTAFLSTRGRTPFTPA